MRVICTFTIVSLALIGTVMVAPFPSVLAIGNRCPTVWQRSEGINLCIGTELNNFIDGTSHRIL